MMGAEVARRRRPDLGRTRLSQLTGLEMDEDDLMTGDLVFALPLLLFFSRVR